MEKNNKKKNLFTKIYRIFFSFITRRIVSMRHGERERERGEEIEQEEDWLTDGRQT